MNPVNYNHLVQESKPWFIIYLVIGFFSLLPTECGGNGTTLPTLISAIIDPTKAISSFYQIQDTPKAPRVGFSG
jgi:hypothetical protein